MFREFHLQNSLAYQIIGMFRHTNIFNIFVMIALKCVDNCYCKNMLNCSTGSDCTTEHDKHKMLVISPS